MPSARKKLCSRFEGASRSTRCRACSADVHLARCIAEEGKAYRPSSILRESREHADGQLHTNPRGGPCDYLPERTGAEAHRSMDDGPQRGGRVDRDD